VCVDGDVIGDEVENMRVDAWKLGFGSGFRDLTQVSCKSMHNDAPLDTYR
jgi:hypothetical protein